MDDAEPMSDVRMAAARRLHPGSVDSPALDRLSGLARGILRCSSAQVSLTTDVASTVGSAGVPTDLRGQVPVTESLCAQTALQGRPLVINDAHANALSSGLDPVRTGVVGSFLGVPIRADDRSAVGAICAFDPSPRVWNQDDVEVLQALAESAATELELAALARDFEASRTRWDLAIEAAEVGTFDWDLRTGRLSWDETLIELFGYGDDDVFQETIEAFNARLHPDDVAPVTHALQRAIDTVGVFEADYRIVLPDGTVRFVQARGRATGENGVTDRVLGAAWDVSLTQEGQDRATRIVEAMPVAYVRIDRDGTVTAANHVAEQLLRVSRLDLLSKRLWDVVPEAVAARLDEVCRGCLDTGDPSTVELYLDAPVSAWLEIGVWPETAGLSLFFADISARRAARAIAERDAAHDRSVAQALQNALLTTLPERDHLEFCARYIAAADGERVGGDWYDAVLQPDGATVVVVGDVSGHDINAAATMGQLRSMLRAFIWQRNDPPAAVTARLDRAVRDLYPGATATAAVARIEQDEQAKARDVRVLRWTSAGHLPPIVVDRAGATRILETSPELMLGIRAETLRHDHTTELPPGSTLVLYTDGLVERRSSDLDEGIERLAVGLRRHHDRPVSEMVDAVLAEMLDVAPDDDIVVLAIRVHPQDESA